MKFCSSCNSTKDLSEFYRCASKKDGVITPCKECKKAYSRKRRLEHPEEHKEYCRRYYKEHAEQLKSNSAVYKKTHRIQANAWRYKWVRKNPERSNAIRKRSYQATRDRFLLRVYRWRRNNPDKVRLIRQRWYQRHRAYVYAQNAAYRMKRRGIAGQAVIKLPDLANRDNWCCHLCTKRVTKRNWSRDHLIPLSLGGLNTWENVALAHRMCNIRRGAGRQAAQLRLF